MNNSIATYDISENTKKSFMLAGVAWLRGTTIQSIL